MSDPAHRKGRGRADGLIDAVRGSAAAPVLRTLRDRADQGFLRLNRPPLGGDVRGVRLRGFLRHRAFLAGLGTYETATLEEFERLLHRESIVIDGGAHVGLFSLIAASVIGADGHVYAFEPDPYNFSALSYNVAAAGANNVTLVNAALSDSAGHAEFHASSGTIAGSLVDKSYVHDSRRITVETVRLDEMLPRRPRVPTLMKLDLEGAEPRAVAGASSLLEECQDVTLLFEQNPEALRDGGLPLNATFQALQDLGFGIVRLNGKPTSIAEGDELVKGNFMASRAAV